MGLIGQWVVEVDVVNATMNILEEAETLLKKSLVATENLHLLNGLSLYYGRMG